MAEETVAPAPTAPPSSAEPLDFATGKATRPPVAVTNEAGFLLAPDGSVTTENIFASAPPPTSTEAPTDASAESTPGSEQSPLSEADHAFFSENPGLLTELSQMGGIASDEQLAQTMGDARGMVELMAPAERKSLESLQIGSDPAVILFLSRLSKEAKAGQTELTELRAENAKLRQQHETANAMRVDDAGTSTPVGDLDAQIAALHSDMSTARRESRSVGGIEQRIAQLQRQRYST